VLGSLNLVFWLFGHVNASALSFFIAVEPFKKQRRELDNEHFAALNKVAELRQSLLFATSALKSASVQHEYAVSRLEKAVIELHSFDVK